MPNFQFRAVNAGGEVRDGVVEAASEYEAGCKISDMGLIVISVAPDHGHGPVREGKAPSLFGQRGGGQFDGKQLYLFTRELAALLRAGLPLDSALAILSQISDQPAVRETVIRVRDLVRGGKLLSDALRQEPGFGRFYVNMVRAGEVGGVLDEVLTRLAGYLERSRALRETVVSALIYPVILMVVALVSVVILLIFVVPQFSDLFADMGKALPVPTQIVIAAGNILTGYWWVLLGLGLLSVYGVRTALQRPDTRLWMDRRVLRLPLFGELVRKSETTRFARTFGTLLRSGIPVSEALPVAGATAGNGVFAGIIEEAASEVRRGRRISDVLEDSPFPPLAIHLLRVGEESGDLEGMLGQLAEIFDGEVQSTIKRLLAVMEPLLILGLGVVIAGIIVSILIAILGMNELAF